jgi:hypothetical protein
MTETSAKLEHLMFWNDRNIEVRVYKDRIEIVRKNDVLEKGRAVKKNSADIGKSPETHKLLYQSEKHYNVSC